MRTLVYLVSYGPRCEKTGMLDECFKPVSSTIETSLKYEISPAASLHMIWGWGGGGGGFDECFKPVSSAIETSLKYEISPAASLHMILFKKRINRR